MQIRNYFLPIIALIFFSCNHQEQFSNNPQLRLNFSQDTLHFDTVFTSIGTTTHSLKLYNKNKAAIKTTISLGGGANSFFRLNIDGIASRVVNNYELLPNDSAFIFIEANIDPQNSNNPLVIEDSIMFFTNGNRQIVNIIAYGQDVHLLNNMQMHSQTWINDKPYLIYNSVEIAENETLTIEAGTQVHFHNISNMWIRGRLIVKGSKDHKVVFQGDRLEKEYSYNPSQWYGAYFDANGKLQEAAGLFFFPTSKNNSIDNAIIKNGAIGIQLFDTVPNTELALTLTNSQLFNMSAYGFIAQHSNTYVYNTVFGNCKFQAVALIYSGSHQFYHSTIANYYSHDHKSDSPALFMWNYDDKITYDFNAIFGNCIIVGKNNNEFLPYIDNSNNANVSLLFDHCMIKHNNSVDLSNPGIFRYLIPYNHSLFKDSVYGNFRLDTLSTAIDKGSLEISKHFKLDQDGNDRTIDGKPDLGAFEYQ